MTTYQQDKKTAQGMFSGKKKVVHVLTIDLGAVRKAKVVLCASDAEFTQRREGMKDKVSPITLNSGDVALLFSKFELHKLGTVVDKSAKTQRFTKVVPDDKSSMLAISNHCLEVGISARLFYGKWNSKPTRFMSMPVNKNALCRCHTNIKSVIDKYLHVGPIDVYKLFVVNSISISMCTIIFITCYFLLLVIIITCYYL
jgi:hypothetical protein